MSAQKDTTYVERTTDKWTIGLNSTIRSNFFEIFDEQTIPFTLRRTDLLTGIRLRYSRLSVVMSFPVKNLSSQENFAPRSFGLAAKLELGKVFFSGRANYFTLASIADLTQSYRENNCLTVNGFAAYVFDGDQLSFSSSFTFLNPQKKTADSWFISTNFNILHSDFTGEFLESQGKKPHDITQYDQFRVSMGVGYVKSHVWENWQLTYLMNIGLEGSQTYYIIKNESSRAYYSLHMLPKINTSISLIYQWEKELYFGLINEWEPSFLAEESLAANVSFWTLRCSIGKRF